MNEKLFKSINQLSGRIAPIDFLMVLISNKIRYVFVFVLIYMWFKNDSYRKIVTNAGISAGITLLIHAITKAISYRPRPFIKRRVGILIPSKRDSTFPSKHTLLAFAVSTTIYLYNRTVGSIMLILSVLTGFSRVWVGHHYPYDVIGSAIIASFTSILYEKASKRTPYISIE